MGQIDWDLLNASTNGDLEKAKWAIENGADVNAKDKDGRTPLHHASFDGHDNIVSLMLEKGADVNAKDDTGFTPLHVASEFGYEAVVSLLLEKGANVDAKDEYGNTPLHWAIMNGLENIVSLLLENGADVNAKCNSGWTPLHWASEYGHESVVSLLLKKGADVNAKSNSGKTSLNDACRSGKVTVVAILLHNGADVSVKDIGGETPLHDACEHGDEAVVSLLLDNGADVNVKNKIGWTPLHYACRSGRVAVVSLLLENGADSTITIFNGKTALQIAQEKNKQNCVAVLEEFAQRQEKKQLESQEVKAQEETKKRHQPQEEVASAKKKKDGSMELELVERSIYNRALAQGNTTLGRIRLMMCGPYGVGKTSIVRSLRGEPFNDEYNSTEGIDAVGRVDKHTLGNDLDFKQASRQWIMKNQSLKSNHVELLFEDSKNRRRQDLQSFVVFPKQSSNSQASNPELEPSQKPEDNGICITIWDFAGQIKYHCMHQMFFRSNCLYLLVLDLQMNGSGRRSSEEEMLLDAQKWLNAIVSSAGPDIGLIVVGTHADAFQSSDAATDRLEGLLKTLKKMVADVEYDNVLRNVKTAVVDNKNDFGISELKTNLYKTAKGLLGDILVPLSWLRLIEKVREELPLKDNEICAPLEKIQNLANTIGIMEKDQLCAALSFFDRVGELTYIRERELSDWVFTEPQLLLNAMKSLLVPATNLEKFLQRKQQRKLEDYGFLENEALKAIWTQYKNQEQLQHLMAAMGLIIEFPDGVAIPCRLPKEPALWDDKPLEKEIVVTTKYSTRLPPSLYGHALAGLLRHHGTPEQELRLLSQTTSCIEIDSSKCFHQNEQAQHTITLRAILQNEQAEHAIALRVCAYPASSCTPDETVLVDTLVRTVKVLVWTLHLLERDRFEWMAVESCVQLRCCGNLREFTILESKRMSESDSAEIAPCQDSFLCPAKIRHSLLDAVDVLSSSQKATANVSQALAQSGSSNQHSMSLVLGLGKSDQNTMKMNQIDQDLLHASIHGYFKKAKRAIEKGADVNSQDDDGYTPLHLASREGNESIASLLLEEGAYVDVKDIFEETPLHCACKQGHKNIVSLLFENGADLNVKGTNGWTPLHWASLKGYKAIVSILLEKGANAKGKDGETPLHVSCREGRENIVSLLLEKGADVNAKRWDGETPLHEACRKGRENIISLLLENGADLTITDNIGDTPWQRAQKEKKQNCVVAIEQFREKKRFQKKYSEEFKTRAALDRELQRLQHLIDAAKDSVDSDVNSAAVAAKAEYEMILPFCKWPQYLSVAELETEIAKLEEQARGMDIGEERISILQKRNELKQYLDGEVLDRAKTPLQVALEQLPDDIRRTLTCPISGDIMKDPVILFPSGKTFNRESLCTWLLRNPMPRCPWTNQPLEQHMTYVENREIRDILIYCLGEEAYVRYDDSTFKVQYQALWNTRLPPADAHPAPTEAPFNVVVSDTFSLFNAGVYYHGDDQFDVAEEYYELAARQGHAGAQYNLAMLNEDNHERMLGYLEQAAAQDHPDALYYLGTLFFDSNVIPQDLNTAREYFQRAAAQGSEEAREAPRYLTEWTSSKCMNEQI